MPAHLLFSVLGLDLGMFYKRRDYTTIVNGRNPILAHEYIGSSWKQGHHRGGRYLASGESILTCQGLKKRKANRIFAMVTFAFFTNASKPTTNL